MPDHTDRHPLVVIRLRGSQVEMGVANKGSSVLDCFSPMML